MGSECKVASESPRTVLERKVSYSNTSFHSNESINSFSEAWMEKSSYGTFAGLLKPYNRGIFIQLVYRRSMCIPTPAYLPRKLT